MSEACAAEGDERRVEFAIERVLAKQPPMDQAPKGATCYICLEGEDDGSKLMRGCACRGDSAGFAHIECLTELAKSKEASEDLPAVFQSWLRCCNCKHDFQRALGLEMRWRFWRHYHSRQDLHEGLRFHSAIALGQYLGRHGEFSAAYQLCDEATICAGDNKEPLLEIKLLKANMLIKSGQKLEILEHLPAMVPEAKAYTARPDVYYQTILLITRCYCDLDRKQEAHETATELVAFSKANYSPDNAYTLTAMRWYANACVKLGRVDEAKAIFEDIITTHIRVLGRDHPLTQITIKDRQLLLGS